MHTPIRTRLIAAAALATIAAVVAAAQAQPDLVARARAIHDRVIALDTHNDIDPQNFTADCNYTMRLTTQVNLPKMKEGGLDVSFFIAYVGQDELTPAGYDAAYRAAIAKFDAVHRLTEQIAPNQIELALTPAGVVQINAVADFIKADPKERAPAIAALRDEFGLSGGRGGGGGAGRGAAAPATSRCPIEGPAPAAAAGGGGRGRGAQGAESLPAD